MKRKLKIGDRFNLEVGMNIIKEIPSHFVYSNASTFELVKHDLVVGDILRVVVDLKEYTKELSCGCVRCYKHVDDFPFDMSNTIDTNQYVGEYTVITAVMDGGGTGHGMHDTYPDGHHIVAAKMVDDQVDFKNLIEFYQSGAFHGFIDKKEITLISEV